MRAHRTLLIFWFIMALLVTQSATAKELPDFTVLVEKYQPAVVNISTTRTVKTQRFHQLPQQPFGQDDPFNDLLRRFFGEQMGPEEYDTKSLGSGFIISADGDILTNNHVIQDADEIVVRLSDGREYQATVVGADEGTDLALLKIDETNLPKIKFGSSDNLKVGEWVLAIGSPFGFEHSVTAGIVSAKKRGLRTGQYVPFIQTDVAINPGNSGGPLFNLSGEVVGINAQILSRSGGYLGLSFAIPSDIAQHVIAQLKGKGFVSRGWLGVAFQNIDRNLAQSFGLDAPNGALVAQVVEDSPADKGGLKQGDIIVKFNGKLIKDASELSPLVGNIKPGKTVKVEVIRNRKPKQLKVTIVELNHDKDKADAESSTLEKSENALGILIRDFTDAERSRYDLGDKGVLIEQVKRASPAAKVGIRRGDILLSVNMMPINSVRDFAKATKKLETLDTVPVLVSRNNEGQRYFAVNLKKK